MATGNIQQSQTAQVEYSSSDASTSTTANMSNRAVSKNAFATYVFRKCWKTLEDNLKGEGILTELYCKDVLTKPEREDIENLQSTKNRLKLIETMMTKDKGSVQIFIIAIKNNTAGQEYIVKELEEAVKDFELQATKQVENSDTQDDHTTSTTATPNGIWFEVEFPVASFTGRETELQKLHDHLTKSERPTVINQISTISGLGGIGKSELARKYAHKFKHYYNGNIMWINAETRQSFRNSFVQLLAQYFSISEEKLRNMSEKEMIQVVYNYFTGKQRCLIIFDNVEDFNVIELLPKSLTTDCKIPSVLITSRKTTWEHGVQILELNVLSEDEAIDFIQSAVEMVATKEDSAALAEKLQCLPLALQQAVAYIRYELINNSNPIQKYIELFNKQEMVEEVLDYKNLNKMNLYEKTTYNTWTVTIEVLKSKPYGKLALELISIISFFEPDSIPTIMFADFQLSHKTINRSILINFFHFSFFFTLFYFPFSFLTLFPFSTKIWSNSKDLVGIDAIDRAVGLLKSYSIVSGEPGIINIHRLVQRVVRLKLTTNETENSLEQGLELLYNYMRLDPGESDLLKHLLPHSESVWKHSFRHDCLIKEYSVFPTAVCKHLFYYGRYEAALVLARDSIPVVERGIERKHANMICLIQQEATALYYLKKYRESIEIINSLHPLAKSEFGSDHQITWEIYNLLALNLDEQGNYIGALTIYEENEVILIRKFGDEHLDTLTTLHNKASTLFKLGRLEEAKKLFESVYAVNKRLLGENCAETLTTRHWIARVLEKKGDLKQALKEHEEVYQAMSIVLGEDHPSTIISLEDINYCKAKINNN